MPSATLASTTAATTATPPSAPLKVGVIIGSTRPGRFADTVAQWFLTRAGDHDGIDLEVVDLARPEVLDELLRGVDPRRGPGEAGLAERIDAQDAFVVLTPEYNHSFPGVLKLALDSAYGEWRAKPVGFVSYGGHSGGSRAVEQLRQVFAELHVVTMRDSVTFTHAWAQFEEDGSARDEGGAVKALGVMLDQLTWWGRALRTAREERPYDG